MGNRKAPTPVNRKQVKPSPPPAPPKKRTATGDVNVFVINDRSTPPDIRRAANSLSNFFLDSLSKHHPGDEGRAFDNDEDEEDQGPRWP